MSACPESPTDTGVSRGPQLAGSQNVTTDPPTTFILTSPDTSTSGPINSESSLHVTEADDRHSQQPSHQHQELQRSYQPNTDNGTDEQHLGRVITSNSTSSASSTQSYGVALPAGGSESSDVNALGSGMNKGPGLPVESSQSIRGMSPGASRSDLGVVSVVTTWRARRRCKRMECVEVAEIARLSLLPAARVSACRPFRSVAMGESRTCCQRVLGLGESSTRKISSAWDRRTRKRGPGRDGHDSHGHFYE